MYQGKRMEKVSVIIPVYNAGKTISMTVDSIRAQTYENWEIILVNDGSTDDSLKICQSLESDKIHLMNKPNGGVVSAYKMGIENASGSLISFCDADDLYKTDYLENAVKIIREYNCDFVSFGCTLNQDGKDRFTKNAAKDGFYDADRVKNEILPHCLFNDFITDNYYMIHVYRWNKVYKKELINRFMDQLDENCFQIEDNVFTTLAILNAKSLFIDNRSFYEYVIRPQSITTRYTDDLIDSYTYSLSVIKSLADNYLSECNPKQFNYLAYENYRIALRKIAKNSDYPNAKRAVRKIRESGFIDCVKFKEIKLLKNYLFYVLYHAKLDFLLYLSFKLL